MATEQQSGVLAGMNILVVEDEYLLADDVRRALIKVGARVVGPYAELSTGLAAAESGEALSKAVLDINLRGEMAFPIADELRRRGIPFVFTTGYDRPTIPTDYQDVPCCEKPVNTGALVGLLARM